MRHHRSLALLFAATLLACGGAGAQEVNGTLTANGKTAALRYVLAQEVDSATEKGYMDVIVVVSDRKLAAADVQDPERLEAMVRKNGLVALAVRLNPDAKVMSAAPLHPAFTTFLRSAAFIDWKPSAFDEKRIAGRFSTAGMQREFGQQWSYDVTFSAPIALDPAARTVPRQ
jgi:hypothetical protein